MLTVVLAGSGALIDLRFDLFRGFAGEIKLGLAAASAVILLISWPREGRGLSVASCAAGLVSLAGTAVLRSVSGPGSEASDAFGFTEPAVLLVLLALVAWRGAPAGTVLAVPVLVAAIVLRPMAVGVQETGVVLALFLALVAMMALGAGLAGRLFAADRRRREETVRLEQRAEFARDLHDFVAHHVTGIVVQAQGARTIAAKRPELVLPALEEIERAGAQTLTSMRRMVGMLRESGEGLSRTASPDMASVRSLVGGFSLPGGVKAHFTARGGSGELPPEVAGTVHRVVMEALTNVRKHGLDCTAVEVLVDRAPDRVAVRVHDDGRRRHGTGGGFGLKGLEERVSMVGGTLRAGPGPDGGWAVEASLPVEGAP